MMTKSLRERAEDAAQQVHTILGVDQDERPKEVADAIEKTIIKALLEERHRCADVAFQCCEEDKDKAHKVADEIRRVNTALMANLSSMR
jgi:hypothetical protein